jgi:hypothetical protein
MTLIESGAGVASHLQGIRQAAQPAGASHAVALAEDGENIRNSSRADLWPAARLATPAPAPGTALTGEAPLPPVPARPAVTAPPVASAPAKPPAPAPAPAAASVPVPAPAAVATPPAAATP